MGAAPSNLDRQRRLARAAFSAGDAGTLQTACQALIDADPLNVEARRLLGRQALRDLNFPEAEHYLREAAAHDPSTPASWLDLARLLVERRRIREAEAALSAAHARGVRSPGFLTYLGVLQLAMGRHHDASEHLQSAYHMDRDHMTALRWLALIGGFHPGDRLFTLLNDRLNTDQALSLPRRAMGHYALGEAALHAGEDGLFVDHVLQANAAQASALDGVDPHLDALKQTLKALTTTPPQRQHAPDSDPQIIFVLASPGGGAALAELALASACEVRMGGHLGALTTTSLATTSLATTSLATNSWASTKLGVTPRKDARSPMAACASYDTQTRVGLAERYVTRAHQLDGPVTWPCSDSDPGNLALVPLAAALFGNAKFVRVRRDHDTAGLATLRHAHTHPALHHCDVRAIGRGVALSEAVLDAFCANREDVIAVDHHDLLTDLPGTGATLGAKLGIPRRTQAESPPAHAGGLAAWAEQTSDLGARGRALMDGPFRQAFAPMLATLKA